jgi:hypothetical protein
LAALLPKRPLYPSSKKEVIELLARYPNQREQLIADYKSAFPYSFFDDLKAATLQKNLGE